MGFFLGKKNPNISEYIARPLIRFGIPLSVMGLLLKEGIDLNLIKSAFLAFSTIGFLIVLVNRFPIFKKRLPNYTLQLAGLIGNTSFLGIPIAIALLPTNIINFTIGFDLGTTLFAWIFGPMLLQREKYQSSSFTIKELTLSLFSSPASKGILGALLAYLISLDSFLGKVLWIPARIVIILAIVVVGSRLGIITKSKNKIFKINNGIRNSIILKLLIFPLLILLTTMLINIEKVEILALVLQAGTPSAISTILMAEAYKKQRELAAKALFTTTIISTATIPLIFFIINY